MSSEKTAKTLKIAKRAIRYLAICLMFAVILFVFFRVFAADYYPSSMKSLLLTEELASYYEEHGLPSFVTQELRVKYDSSKDGNFFADHLLLSEEAGALQITVRYNESTLERLLAEEKMTSLDEGFRYRLFACTGGEDDALLGNFYTEYERESDAFFVYHYERLAFGGLETDGVVWIRLDVLGAESGSLLGSIVVFENNEDYSKRESVEIAEELFER